MISRLGDLQSPNTSPRVATSLLRNFAKVRLSVICGSLISCYIHAFDVFISSSVHCIFAGITMSLASSETGRIPFLHLVSFCHNSSVYPKSSSNYLAGRQISRAFRSNRCFFVRHPFSHLPSPAFFVFLAIHASHTEAVLLLIITGFCA